MKTARLLTALAVLATFAALPPAAEETFSAFPNALGMFGSTLSGNAGGGLHYQRWGKAYGWQVTAGGFYDPVDATGRPLEYSMTLDGLRALYTNYYGNAFSGRLYLWGSVGHQGYIAGDDEPNGMRAGTLALDAVCGLGIGMEVTLLQHFSFPFQFGYSGTFPSTPRISFTVAGGLRYRY